MINHSDIPVWIGSPKDVNGAIRKSLLAAASFIGEEYGAGPGLSYEAITSGPDSVQLSFLKYFRYAPEISTKKLTNEWLLEAFKYISAAKGDLESVDMDLLFGEVRKDYRKSVYTWVKRGLWLALIILYKNRYVALPANFSALSYNSGRGEAGTRTDFAFEMYPEIMKFLVSARYKLAKNDFWAAIPQKVCERIAQYGSRLFWMCGVTIPEEIDLNEVIEVHLTYSLGERLLAAEIPTKAIMQYVCHYYSGRVPFTFEEFLSRLELAKRDRRSNYPVLTSEEEEVTELSTPGEIEPQLFKLAAGWNKRSYLPDRISRIGLYRPWTDVLKKSLEVWLQSQIKYLAHKKYERVESSAIGIAWFNTYLFEFLPRWYLMKGLSWGSGYPSLPRELTNAFISPAVPAADAPPSFENYLEHVLQENAETAPYTIMLQLKNFCEWVQTKYQGVPGYEGFTNPVHEMDLPPSNNRNESKARPFTKWQYSIALNYLAAIVRAIRLINDHLIIGDISLGKNQDLNELAIKLGWDNTFYWSGRMFTISSIPEVFLEPWSIPTAGGTYLTLLLPHYVIHVLAAVDSGLRHQSVRWLCVDFDRFIVEGTGAVAFKLHVAVDKVSDAPVETYVALQTLEALRYQREIRSLVDLDIFKSEVFYRGNKGTKKGKFKPLFSSDFRSGHPRGENAYANMYVNFLVGLNFFLNDHDLQCKMFELKAKGHPYEAVVTHGRESRTKDGHLYCALSLVTDMTPHHTRSSTVNTWSRFLTAKDVGRYKTAHKSEAVVRYYRKLDDEDREDLSLHLNNAVSQIWSGDSINPALENSNYRRALSSDPEKAVFDFGCISMSAMGSGKEVEGVQRIVQGHHSGLAHYPTHICTRNGDCTQEMKAAGIADRCGFCVFAVKGIDNLEAIEVKIVNLTDEVRALHEYADGLSNKNQHELIKVDERLEVVVCDLLAWVWCRDHLVLVAEEFKSDPNKLFAYRPEILKKDFRKFNTNEQSASYILSRLHQDSQFPDLISGVARARYKALKIALLGGRASVLDLFKNNVSDSPVELVSMIKSMVKQSGMSLESVAVAWDSQDARATELLANHRPVFLTGEEE